MLEFVPIKIATKINTTLKYAWSVHYPQCSIYKERVDVKVIIKDVQPLAIGTAVEVKNIKDGRYSASFGNYKKTVDHFNVKVRGK